MFIKRYQMGGRKSITLLKRSTEVNHALAVEISVQDLPHINGDVPAATVDVGGKNMMLFTITW